MNGSEKKQKALIFLCWLVYTSAYLGRYSYNANINPIMADYSVSHASAGLVTTFFFFAYGIGQVVNGVLCKYYNKKYVLSGALLLSALINLIVFFGVKFPLLKYLWLVNGFAQSVLWSSLVLVLGRELEGQNLKKAVLVISTTTPVGTLLSYGLGSLLALSGNYPFSFLTGGIVLAAVAFVWLLSYGKLVGERSETPAEKEKAEPTSRKNSRKAMYPTVILLALFAVINNLIKDGLSTWVPSILKESYGLSDSLSVFLTLSLPVLGIFGAATAVALNKKIKDFISLSTVFFVSSGIMIFIVVVLLGTEEWLPVLICFGMVSLLMSAINNVVTSMSPLYLRERLNSGRLSGILNGFCYLGSTISSYGLGVIADGSGWSGVFKLFCWLCLGVVLAGGIYSMIRKRKANKAEG